MLILAQIIIILSKKLWSTVAFYPNNRFHVVIKRMLEGSNNISDYANIYMLIVCSMFKIWDIYGLWSSYAYITNIPITNFTNNNSFILIFRTVLFSFLYIFQLCIYFCSLLPTSYCEFILLFPLPYIIVWCPLT